MALSISGRKAVQKGMTRIVTGLRITLLTIILSVFMHQGWYQPALLHAATITLYPAANTITGTVTNPANVYANDNVAATISSSTSSETTNTFTNTNLGTISDVTVWVKYKTSTPPINDTYAFDAALDGVTFNQSIVASNITSQTAYITASKSLGALTWAQVGTLAVKCTTVKTGGADGYTVDWDVAYIVVTYKTDQTITVGTPSPASAPYNSQFTVAATASSGLPVTYSSGSTSVCTNSGATFTMLGGTGTCIVQYDQTGDATYNAAARLTNNVTATKIVQATVTVTAPASAYYGQAGLSATAAGGSGTGAYSYGVGTSTACTVNASTGALTIISGTGTCSINATRAGDINYNVSTASAAATVSITKATPTVSAWPIASAITYGQTLASSTLTGGTASTGGTFAFTTPATAPNAGTALQGVTFTPTDSINYNTVAGTVSVIVNKATATVSVWPIASAITYGQTLASSILTAGTASVPGNFAFTTPATAPNAGTALQSVTFTPTDSINYNTVAGTVSVIVNMANQTITFGALTSKVYGDASFTLTATGGASGNPVTFASSNLSVATVTGNTVTIVGAGITTITASQAGNINYNAAADVFQALTVDKATPAVSVWPTASAITYSQTLASSTLTGGTASTGGTFAFTTPATAPNAGTAPQGVTFTPTDTTNYNNTTGSVSVMVNKANQAITFAALTAKNVGDPDFAPGATASSGLTVTYASSNTVVATIVGGMIHIVGAGSANITASQAGNANYDAAIDVIQALTVNAASNPTLNVTINGNGSVNSSPTGISCTTGTCSATFTSGQSVSLTATTSWNYDFTGWSGACTGLLNPCNVVVSSLTNVTATFSPKQLVKSGTSYYASMQEAYNAALEGAVLQGRNDVLTENLDFNRAVNVTFNGGNDATWIVTGYTTINGTVTMAGGGVTISNMIIQ